MADASAEMTSGQFQVCQYTPEWILLLVLAAGVPRSQVLIGGTPVVPLWYPSP